jgi:hypothetical protein
MRGFIIIVSMLAILTACGVSLQPERQNNNEPSLSPVENAQQVIDKIKAAGIIVDDRLPSTQGDKALQSIYKDHEGFQVRDAGKSYAGQVLLCANKIQCDNLYHTTEPSAKSGLIRIWRSKDGLVICMIETSLSDATATQIQQVIETLP